MDKNDRKLKRKIRGGSFPPTATQWLELWYQSHGRDAGLNAKQKQALFLPFSKKVSLIEGPPGTGKTHLLVWTLAALCAYAKSLLRPIKILVTAQTHQAIDQILVKTAKTWRKTAVEGVPLWKYGRYDRTLFSELDIRPLEESKTLMQEGSLLVGATGFGLYQLLEGKRADSSLPFRRPFHHLSRQSKSEHLPPRNAIIHVTQRNSLTVPIIRARRRTGSVGTLACMQRNSPTMQQFASHSATRPQRNKSPHTAKPSHSAITRTRVIGAVSRLRCMQARVPTLPVLRRARIVALGRVSSCDAGYNLSVEQGDFKSK